MRYIVFLFYRVETSAQRLSDWPLVIRIESGRGQAQTVMYTDHHHNPVLADEDSPRGSQCRGVEKLKIRK